MLQTLFIEGRYPTTQFFNDGEREIRANYFLACKYFNKPTDMLITKKTKLTLPVIRFLKEIIMNLRAQEKTVLLCSSKSIKFKAI